MRAERKEIVSRGQVAQGDRSQVVQQVGMTPTRVLSVPVIILIQSLCPLGKKICTRNRVGWHFQDTDNIQSNPVPEQNAGAKAWQRSIVSTEHGSQVMMAAGGKGNTAPCLLGTQSDALVGALDQARCWSLPSGPSTRAHPQRDPSLTLLANVHSQAWNNKAVRNENASVLIQVACIEFIQSLIMYLELYWKAVPNF